MKAKVLSILATVLILLLTSSSMALANTSQTADKDAVLRTSDYLTTYFASISAQGNNQVKISFTIQSKAIMDKIGVLQIEIERNPGSGWVYDRTLRSADYDNFIKNNAMANKSSVNFTGVAGYQYRATVIAYAADGGDSDSRDTYTGKTTCY